LAATLAIDKRIYVIRGRQVILDEDLADLYLVETKRLIEQVKRNLERFPEDFMFQLRKDEAAALRSQTATSKTGRGGRRISRSCGRLSSSAGSPAPTRRSRRGRSKSNEGWATTMSNWSRSSVPFVS
jgi:hypothetical protein